METNDRVLIRDDVGLWQRADSKANSDSRRVPTALTVPMRDPSRRRASTCRPSCNNRAHARLVSSWAAFTVKVVAMMQSARQNQLGEALCELPGLPVPALAVMTSTRAVMAPRRTTGDRRSGREVNHDRFILDPVPLMPRWPLTGMIPVARSVISIDHVRDGGR